MSLPPVHARPSPPSDTVGVQARPGQDDASTRSGKPFDILLAERGGPPHAPPLPKDGDARQGRDSLARTVAEMFNENGLFAGAADLHPQSPGAIAAQRTGSVGIEALSAQPASAAVPIGPQAPSVGGDVQATPPSAVSAGGPASAEMSSNLAGRPAGFLATPSAAWFAGWTTGSPTRVTTQQASRSVIAAGRASVADARRSVAGQESPAAARADKRLAAAIEEHLRRSSANPVRVEVRAAADGLVVTASTEKLDRGERSRLRTEIAALLSRHGRVPARIGLNGDFAPIRQV